MEGEASIVLKDFLWLEAGGLGLQLNRAKCEVTGHRMQHGLYALRTAPCTGSVELLRYSHRHAQRRHMRQRDGRGLAPGVSADQVGRSWSEEHCFAGSPCLLGISREYSRPHPPPPASASTAVAGACVNRRGPAGLAGSSGPVHRSAHWRAGQAHCRPGGEQ